MTISKIRCNKASNLEKVIAKTYLFLLPVRMISPLLGVAELFHGAAVYFDFLLHILGIVIYLIEHRYVLKIDDSNSTRAFKTFAITVCILNMLSLIMAVVTQFTKGNYAGETAFSGILGMEIYLFQYMLMIAYNRRIFHILEESEIKKIISASCLALLILGYYQILVLLFGGIFWRVLNVIDIFHVLWPEASMWKLSLTGKEGASAGSIFSIFVLPYLLGKLLDGEKRKVVLIQIIFWIPVLVMMKSSSAYLMVMADIVGFLLCVCSKDTRKKIEIIVLGGVILICLVVFGEKLIELLPSDVSYLMFEKTLDMNNGSTVARMVPIITNWKSFLQEPFIGVGNGLQGYYYIEFFPQWARNVAGSDVMNFYNLAKNQIINGGLFFPSLLSGYGIVGIILILNIIIKIKKRLYDMKHVNTFAYNYFKIAIWAIIVCGFQSEFAGNYFIWFVIGLPFMEYTEEKNKI